MKKLSFIQNTVVLVFSNLFTGSLAFLFSIILSKEIGAQGMGIYQLVMPVYMLFICITCGGTTTAISKIVSEKSSRGNTMELFKSISVAAAFFSAWTIFMSIILVLMSPFLSASILKDTRTYLPMLLLVPALICVSMGSIFKGYFYGLQNSTFPAIIDILEKAVRIIVLITLVYYLRPYGLKYEIAGAVGAMTAGEITSFCLLYIFYKRSHPGVKHLTGSHDNIFQIIADILSISLPLCINGLVSTILGTFIAVMVPRRLQAAGFAPETSLALFGKVSGMALNVIMFPSIIIGAISIILVPVISEASSGRSKGLVNRRILSTIKVTTAIAALSAALFFSIPDELGRLFYNRDDLGSIIFSLSFGVIFIYIESTLFGILNGLGKQGVLLRNTIIMSVIDITVLYTLLGIPAINIYGYGINFVVSPLVGCILNALEIRRVTDIEISLSRILLFPLMVAAAEGAIVTGLKKIVFTSISNPGSATVLLILVGIGVYIILYLLFDPYSKESL